jgi:hypothetical protein
MIRIKGGMQMAETPNSGQSGGISNTGTMIAQNVAGRDITNNTTTTCYSPTQIHNVWQSVADAIQAAPPEKQTEATTKLQELKAEAAKGTKAEDTTLARLVKGLVGLVPSAVSAVASAFGTPILGGVAGPVTKFVLEELGADKA